MKIYAYSIALLQVVMLAICTWQKDEDGVFAVGFQILIQFPLIGYAAGWM